MRRTTGNLKPEEALRELLKRDKVNKGLDSFLFDKQINFINDPARLKAVQSSRRAGKSSLLGAYLFKVAYNVPNSTCIYLGLTKETSTKIMIKDILNPINDRMGIEAELTMSPYIQYKLKNGSVIYVLGLDKDKQQAHKLFGQKFSLAVIDEAASFTQDLEEIVYKVIKPGTMDYKGTVVLGGTTQNNLHSFFYKVTSGKEPGWSVHKWTGFDNPHMREAVEEEIADMERLNPRVRETAFFRQMYLNEWVVDDSKIIYKYSDDRNLIDKLPFTSKRWINIMGIDLGFNDATAITILSYSYDHRACYIRHCYTAPELDITRTAMMIKTIASMYTPIAKYIVDGASKQAVEEIKNRHHIPLEKAEKVDKADFMQLMSDELIQGNIMVVKGNGTEQLTHCWKELVYAKDSTTEEDPGIPNDIADASLYAWRHCYNYYSKVQEIFPPNMSKLDIDAVMKKRDVSKQQDKRKKTDWWEKYEGGDND